MTTDEIIAMAREADPFGEDGRLFAMASVAPGTLERFAALVAAKEREACAQVCDAERQDFGGVAAGPMTTDAGKRVHEAMAAGAANCAAAIRARASKGEV